MKVFQKLVRDNIPEIIAAQGKHPNVRILGNEAYLYELDRKLNEEIAEYQESKELEELADVLEVIDAICAARGYTVESLLHAKEKKHFERGGFTKRIMLESVK